MKTDIAAIEAAYQALTHAIAANDNEEVKTMLHTAKSLANEAVSLAFKTRSLAHHRRRME